MPHSVRDVNITKVEPLVTPEELLKELPATAAIADGVYEGREQIKRIISGEDQRLLFIVGPCSIHDEQAGLEYAQRLCALAERLSDRMLVIMRVYFEKPRTTVGWKGLIYDPHLNGTLDIADGLYRARSFLLKIREMGIPAATEFLDPIVPQYLADLVSWGAIGARTIESQIHRQMASGLSMPIGFKNSTDGSVQNAVDAIVSARSAHGFLGIDQKGRASMIQTTGNPYGHLILRGGKNGANYAAEAIAKAQGQLQTARLPSQLMVDCSHANSEKDHMRQAIAFRDVIAQRLAGNSDIIGCMVESHLMPGSQKLGTDPSTLQYGVSITDACIGWDETEWLLNEAHEACAVLAAS
jgi:3-deoxy-7-phosphoheptulonate synthase